MLERAKRTRRTDFGRVGVSAHTGTTQAMIETSQGLWRLNGDGTVTDISNKLMWIQAPWGLKYTAQGFEGKALRINWDDATKLFGRGSFQYSDRWCSTPEPLTNDPRDWEATAFEQGYKTGLCTVQFAGRNDWRLPTVQEWCFLTTAIGSDLHPKILPAVSRDTYYWTASGLEKPPFFLRKGGISWLGRFTIPLDENAKLEYPILFLRRV